MRKKPISLPDPAEAAGFDPIMGRRIEPAEQARWHPLASQPHYQSQAMIWDGRFAVLQAAVDLLADGPRPAGDIASRWHGDFFYLNLA